MSTYSKLPLSGSTDGRGIKVHASSIGSGTTIHTATSDATLVDVVDLFAHNASSSPIALTIGWGGTTNPDDVIIQSIPAQSGLTVIVLGLVLRNSLVIKASAVTIDQIAIFGSVNRIS